MYRVRYGENETLNVNEQPEFSHVAGSYTTLPAARRGLQRFVNRSGWDGYIWVETLLDGWYWTQVD